MQKHLSIYFRIPFSKMLYIDVRAAVHHGRLSRGVRMNRSNIEISIISLFILSGLNEFSAMHATIDELEEAGFDTGELEEESIKLGCELDDSYQALAWGMSYGDA